MPCLTDIEVQAVVDDEASEDSCAHAMRCQRCRVRVDERRRQMAAIVSLVSAEPAPSPAMEARLRHAMARHAVTSNHEARGSTVLRVNAGSRWSRLGWASALATAVVIAAFVFGVLPRFDAPTELSASEVLSRSLQTLTSGSGVELLTYEVTMDGMTAGPVVIRQVIDRENPQRYKVESFAPDGELHTALSQDPTTQRRAQLIHVDGINYIVRVAGMHSPMLSLPQMAQAIMETSIGIMQAKSDQQLTIEDGPTGQRYIIDIPPVTPANPATTLDIFGARAVISAGDFRIQEFEATGTLLRQAFSVSVKLREHQVLGPTGSTDTDTSVTERTVGAAPSFDIEPGPGDVVLEGQAADDPVTELLTTVVRELARAQGR